MPWVTGDDEKMLYTSEHYFQPILPHGVVIGRFAYAWLYGTGAFMWRGLVPSADTKLVVYSLREEPGKGNLEICFSSLFLPYCGEVMTSQL